MNYSLVITIFLSFFVINFVLTQSATLDISKFGGKPNGDITKVQTFDIASERNWHPLMKKRIFHINLYDIFLLSLFLFFTHL